MTDFKIAGEYQLITKLTESFLNSKQENTGNIISEWWLIDLYGYNNHQSACQIAELKHNNYSLIIQD